MSLAPYGNATKSVVVPPIFPPDSGQPGEYCYNPRKNPVTTADCDYQAFIQIHYFLKTTVTQLGPTVIYDITSYGNHSASTATRTIHPNSTSAVDVAALMPPANTENQGAWGGVAPTTVELVNDPTVVITDWGAWGDGTVTLYVVIPMRLRVCQCVLMC